MEGVFLEVEGEDVMEKAIGGEKASGGFFCRGSEKAGLRTPRDRTEQRGREQVRGIMFGFLFLWTVGWRRLR